MNLTLLFNGQFWVGVVEQIEEGKIKAGKFVFGAEPKDGEVLDFINKHLIRFTSRLSQ